MEQNEEEAIKLFKMSAEQVITGFKYSSIRTYHQAFLLPFAQPLTRRFLPVNHKQPESGHEF